MYALLLVALAAAAPVELSLDPATLSLEGHLEVLHDDALALRFDDAAASGDWRATPHPATGGPVGALWLRATVHNPTRAPLDVWLASEDETVWRFDARVDGGPVRSTGRALAGAERSVPARKPVVALRVPPGTHALLARLEARTSPAQAALTIGSPAALSAELDRDSLVLGVMYGALLIMAVYSLFLSVLVRDRKHALYAAYVASVIGWLAYTDGTLHFLGVTGDLVGSQRVFVVVSHAVTVLVILFARSVLETSRLPRTDRVLRAAAWSIGALAVWGLLAPGFAQLTAFALVSLAAVLVVVVAAARRWRAGYSPAAYYLLGWLMLFLLLAPLAVIQLGAGAGLPIWAWPLGFVIEVGFAAAAIAELARLDRARVEALNRAGTRFVPFEFLSLLGHTDLTEVQKGDNVAQEMSILFSDIRSFTTLVEGRTPEQNFAFINDYLSWMEPPIREHGGFIDSYEGDAVMALFAGRADDAVRAGIGDLRALHRYNAERAARGEPRIRIGVGVNTGALMLGTIGGRERIKCGVIGDPVNLAARIEGMTKQYGAMQLISSDTRDRLVEPGAFTLRELDTVVAKGKSTAVTVLEVLDGLEDEERAAKVATRARYAEGLALYRAGELAGARPCFEDCVGAWAGDTAACLLLERIATLEAEGVPPDWSGTWTLRTK